MSLNIGEKDIGKIVKLIFNPNPSASEHMRKYPIKEHPAARTQGNDDNFDPLAAIAPGSILAPTQAQADLYPLIMYDSSPGNSRNESPINRVILPLATDRYEIEGMLVSAEELSDKLRSEDMPAPNDLDLYYIVKGASVKFIGQSPDPLSENALCYAHPKSQQPGAADRFGGNFCGAASIPAPSWLEGKEMHKSLINIVNDAKYRYVLVSKDIIEKN